MLCAQTLDLFPSTPPPLPGAVNPVARPTLVGAGATSLADVLEALEAMPPAGRRHVEMKSAIKRMGDVLRKPLHDVSAHPSELRALIKDASRASVGLTKERWSRVRSLTLAALRDFGIDATPARETAQLSAAWREHRERLPTKALRAGLSRFMSHCSRVGLEPDEVTAATFEAFEEALRAKSLKGDPQALRRSSVQLWNRAVAEVAGWPQVTIPIERHPRYYSLEWGAFPATFRADVEAFLAHSGSGDELDEDYVRPVKPSTVQVRRRQLRQLATALVGAGTPIEELVDLAALVRPENARKALREQRDRHGKITASLGNKTWLLCVIARYWVKDPERAAELRDLAKQLNVKQKGMTPRNKRRLRQFDLNANVQALLRLPATVLANAEREQIGDPAEARRVMLAVAVELLIVAPMRVGNLTQLEPDRHLLVFGRGKRRNLHLVVPPEDTKNGEEFETILRPETGRLLETYLRTYRPHLCRHSSAYLFPSRGSECRDTTSFSQAISKFVERETGLKMHAHLFRSLAGKLHLDRNPGDLETVRRVLGHRSSDTTARYYVDQRTSQAFKSFDETITALREEPEAEHRPARSGR
jgi:integrase